MSCFLSVIVVFWLLSSVQPRTVNLPSIYVIIYNNLQPFYKVFFGEEVSKPLLFCYTTCCDSSLKVYN
jgi:hypothetical protein